MDHRDVTSLVGVPRHCGYLFVVIVTFVVHEDAVHAIRGPDS